MLLFSNCQTIGRGLLYSNERAESKETGAPFEMPTAFSREGNEEVHMQYRLADRRKEGHDCYMMKRSFVFVVVRAWGWWRH